MSASNQELTEKAQTHRQNLITQSRMIADAKSYAQKRMAEANQKMSDARAAEKLLEQKKADYHNQLGSHFDNALRNHGITKTHSGEVTLVQTHAIVSVPEGVYQQIWDCMSKSGYRLVHFNGYEVTKQSYFRGLNTQTFFNVIFIKDRSLPWASFHGLDAQHYQARLDQYKKDGFRLAYINSYLSGGQVRYAPIFVKQQWSPWVAYYGVTVQEHQSRFNDLTKQGYRPVNLSPVYYNGTLYYAGLYDKQSVGAWEAWSNLDIWHFQGQYDKSAMSGKVLSYLDVCSVNRAPVYSAIWDSSRPADYRFDYNIDAAKYHNLYLTMLSQRLAPKIIAGYQNGDDVNYSAMWAR